MRMLALWIGMVGLVVSIRLAWQLCGCQGELVDLMRVADIGVLTASIILLLLCKKSRFLEEEIKDFFQQIIILAWLVKNAGKIKRGEIKT